MFGRKKTTPKSTAQGGNVEKKRETGGNDLAAMFGLQMPDDEDDETLEAELAALQGGSVKKKPSGASKQKPMSMAEIEKLTAESSKLGEFDDGDLDDIDDSDLLAELEDLSDDEDTADRDDSNVANVRTSLSSTNDSPSNVSGGIPKALPRATAPTATPCAVPVAAATAASPVPSAAQAMSPMETLAARHAMYDAALKYAKAQGDTSKLRRYDRGFKTLSGMMKKAKGGGTINLSELPPELAASASGGVSTPSPAVSPTQPVPQDLSVKRPDDKPVAKPRPAQTPSQPTAEERPSAKPRTAQQQPMSSPQQTSDLLSNVSQPAAVPLSASNTIQDPVNSILMERMRQYLQASHTAANEAEARRMKVTAAKFQKVIKAHDNGQPVDLSQMPPPPAGFTSQYSTANLASAEAKSPSASLTPSSHAAAAAASAEQPLPPQVDTSVKIPTTVMEALVQRQEKYAAAQKQAQEAGESSKARRMGRIAKQYQDAIKATKARRAFDYTELPCPPGYPPIPGMNSGGSIVGAATTSVTAVSTAPAPPATASIMTAPETTAATYTASDAIALTATASAAASAEEPLPPQVDTSVKTPTTVLEALVQRLEKYAAAQKQAQEAGDSSKARRMGRIAKQYQDAIKATKARRAFDYTELPCPPGYPPIPGMNSASSSVGSTKSLAAAASPISASSLSAASMPRSPSAPATPTSSLGSATAVSPNAALPSLSTSAAAAPRPSLSNPASIKSVGVPSSSTPSATRSANDEQLAVVKARMDEYKSAALAAKAAGRTTEAISHMRSMKGMEPMLTAAESGLPVDISTLPPSFTSPGTVHVEQKKRSRTEEDDAVFARLAEGLDEQIAACQKNADQYRLVGDVKGAAAFDQEVSNLQADLDMLNNANRYEEAAPRFHYEEREFSIVRSFPELGESDADVTVEQCHSLPLPSGYKEKDMNVYVVVTFPYPHDEEPSEKTHTVKSGGISPVFQKSFRFSIDRKARSLARTIKRYPVRLEVFYERGFLKSDQSLGVGSVQIGDLETLSEVHASVDLMEGRKACGGKIEARVRFRQPLTGQDVHKTKHRWLVIDDYVNRKSQKPSIPPPQAAQRVKQASSSAAASSSSASSSQPVQCMEVLKYEVQRLDKVINELKASKKPVPSLIQQRHQAATERASALESRLRSGGKPFLRSYIAQLRAGVDKEQARAKQLLQSGDRTGAQNALVYKKLIGKELERWANASL